MLEVCAQPPLLLLQPAQLAPTRGRYARGRDTQRPRKRYSGGSFQRAPAFAALPAETAAAVGSSPPSFAAANLTRWMTLLAESLIVAAQCQAQFVCITGVGAIGAARKILDGRALSLLSRVYLRLLLPCLMLGLSTSFSAERLQEWSPILVVACCHTAVGFGLGRLTALAMRLQSPHTELLVLTTAFGNCGSLPFVLVLPVATNWKAMQDHPDALSEGMAIIGLCAPDPTPVHALQTCR